LLSDESTNNPFHAIRSFVKNPFVYQRRQIVTISRRKFLKTGILTSVVAGTSMKLTGQAATSQPSGITDALTANTSLDYYTKATFQSYLNSDFRIYSNGHRKTWLRLVLVEDFPTREALTAPDECFRLLFSAPAETSLQQGTYAFDHAALGTFALFIVPRNPVDGKRHYEAVFNRRFSGYLRPSVEPSPNAKSPVKKLPAELWDTNTVPELWVANTAPSLDSAIEGIPRAPRRQKMIDW
jgi:hypothetical protein